MSFQCAHQAFAAAIDDANHGYLGRGNVVSNTQHSTYVRSATETGSNGWTVAAGQLRNFDLAAFAHEIPDDVKARARALTATKGIIVYRFFHWVCQRRIEHGWLITTCDHVELARFVTGPTWKSHDVMRAVAAVIAVTSTPIAA